MEHQFSQTFTAVVHFPDGEGQQQFISYLHENFPMLADEGPRATMLGYGDCVSIADAARMALECDELGRNEQRELALELLDASDWDDCLRIIAEWDLAVAGGKLVDAKTDGMGAKQDDEG